MFSAPDYAMGWPWLAEAATIFVSCAVLCASGTALIFSLKRIPADTMRRVYLRTISRVSVFLMTAGAVVVGCALVWRTGSELFSYSYGSHGSAGGSLMPGYYLLLKVGILLCLYGGVGLWKFRAIIRDLDEREDERNRTSI